VEHQGLGIDFPAARVRLDMLEEFAFADTAGITAVGEAFGLGGQ
jgi:hypothetical protein